MLVTAYLLAGPSTPERDNLTIQVGGMGVGLTSSPHTNSSILHPR